MVYLQTTYELCFGEAYFEYFESRDFSPNGVDEFIYFSHLHRNYRLNIGIIW
jgi:hypothetical protein